MLRLDEPDLSSAIKVAVIQQRRLFQRSAVFGIQPEIAHRVVDIAVAIDIASRYAIPPTKKRREIRTFGMIWGIKVFGKDQMAAFPICLQFFLMKILRKGI